ncbi:MAG TPA: phosphoglycerate mutase family protein [Gaiellaceae bacterium]|nr:phosphoglycerate mutase family protein [Gaiellaceae bacterium]
MTSVLLRHASAGDRSTWDGDDRERPLDRKGRRQAEALVPALVAAGARRAVSSPYVRCVETLEPFAAALGIEVEIDDRLAEGAGRAAAGVLAEDGVVACTHGDVIYELLRFDLKKGAAVVLENGIAVRAIPAD